MSLGIKVRLIDEQPDIRHNFGICAKFAYSSRVPNKSMHIIFTMKSTALRYTGILNAVLRIAFTALLNSY